MKTAILKFTKNSLQSVLLAALALSFANCSSDDDSPVIPLPPVVVEQNPLAGYLTVSGFDQMTTNFINVGDYEFGTSFTPLANGKMTAVVVKLPATRSDLRISIWNKTTSTLIRTETMNVIAADTETVKPITPIDLVAATEYYITYNSNDWYKHHKTDNSNVTYPFTVGDIAITSYRWVSGADQVIPTNVSNNYYAGDLSFKFVKN